MKGLFLIAFVVLFSSSCASRPAEPKPLALEYKAKGPGIAMASDAEVPCIWISDDRTRTSFYGLEITSDDVIPWLQSAIEKNYGATAKVATDTYERGMHISTTRAYINPDATMLTGVVVLRVVWGANDQVYRGQATRSNWWGSESEFQNILNKALDAALEKITLPVGRSSCGADDQEAVTDT